jgi:septal ring factor EnvC (AmiA/AmiB activator)
MGWLTPPPCYTAPTVKKTIFILTLLLAVPAFSEKVKPPTPDEMQATIKNLEDTVVEQEQRLRIHKQEIEALRKTVVALESRLASLEKGIAERRATPPETELAKQ